MAKTPVGLYEHPDLANQVVHDLDARAFSRNEIRILGKPREMSGDRVTSIPRTDFEMGLDRELKAIGASDPNRPGRWSPHPIARRPTEFLEEFHGIAPLPASSERDCRPSWKHGV